MEENQADKRQKILLEKARIEYQMDELLAKNKYLSEQHVAIDEARSKYMAISEQSLLHEYPALSRLATEDAENVGVFMANQSAMIEDQIFDNRAAIVATQNLLDDIERRLMSVNNAL